MHKVIDQLENRWSQTNQETLCDKDVVYKTTISCVVEKNHKIKKIHKIKRPQK